ncbi:hypothetical protein JX265_011545 [Neoarthrinium moseri]|uniref:Uncharacterized protein n=1 Tax=Neoarthrinium moseri TaxID=1658444 RepID=A0A9Q0AJJ9_9PEZI|nr:uncharacterized protein JN550_011705 [Neoarthrinium moseri]KAI1848601.1 hypothetical protein JX266_005460 [Neoarthrinium moseri]KAI1856586.1 hypothetical protein JX265_011545 [Neoarthrinium moseri]KAI1860021.1 hypothetical protein JN550_011705 [Neoarthrinium moseri]
MHFNYSALLLLAGSFLVSALPRPDIGDAVTSGLPAKVQKQVDNGDLSCVEVSDGISCSDQAGRSFFVRDDGSTTKLQ